MKAARWPRVQELTGLSRTSIWRMETEGRFPRRRRLTGNSVAWIEEEVINWLDSRELGMGPKPSRKEG